MSLRLYDNLSNFEIGRIGTGGSTGNTYSWPAPVRAQGTGTTQAIQLPESGLSIGDILVFENNILRTTGYHISDSFLVMTSPPGSDIYVIRYGAGAKGEKGDPGDPGVQGPRGADGSPYIIMGVLPAVIDLPPGGPSTQGWIVESHLYTWNGTTWVDEGDILSSTDGGYNYDMDGGNF